MNVIILTKGRLSKSTPTKSGTYYFDAFQKLQVGRPISIQPDPGHLTFSYHSESNGVSRSESHTRTGNFYLDQNNQIQVGTPPCVQSKTPLTFSNYSNSTTFNHEFILSTAPRLEKASFSSTGDCGYEAEPDFNDSLGLAITPTLSAYSSMRDIKFSKLTCGDLIDSILKFYNDPNFVYAGEFTFTMDNYGSQEPPLSFIIKSSKDIDSLLNCLSGTLSFAELLGIETERNKLEIRTHYFPEFTL